MKLNSMTGKHSTARLSLYRLLLIAVLSCSVTVACSGQNAAAAYKEEARALCDAYNPQTWGKPVEGMDAVDMASTLANKIQAAVKSEEMKKIVIAMPKYPPDKVYDFYRTSVSKLTGEPHQCESIRNYFSYSIE